VLLVPEIVTAFSTNIGGQAGKLVQSIFSSAITTGGLTVIILSAIMGEKLED
jgi:xanthine permease XanP